VWSEQVDLDVTSGAARAFITDALQTFAANDVRIVRLDAVGYVVKKPGTSCFMVEPEIYEFLDWISGVAGSLGMAILPEIHAEYAVHRELARRGYWTYDFVLPGLVLDALRSRDGRRLAAHLDLSPSLQFTALDCHDGIPVRPDLDGIFDDEEMRALAARAHSQGGNITRMLSSAEGSSVDVHQINTTFYSALDADDDRYTAARAIQLFAKGIPQIYYVGLLAGENDIAAVERTGEGRAINRHNYTSDEVTDALDRPVVKRLLDLVRLRNSHPAFDGRLEVEADGPGTLRLRWRHGRSACVLHVDLGTGAIDIDDRP
jgi:sucrose phosphorylase